MDNHHKECSDLVRAALDADALAKDLLKPTDERVRECIEKHRDLMRAQRVFHGKAASHLPEETATLLETLLTENKALREDNANLIEAASWQNETHVLVPREPTEAMIAAGIAENIVELAQVHGMEVRFSDTIKIAVNPKRAYKAMLTATEEEG